MRSAKKTSSSPQEGRKIMKTAIQRTILAGIPILFGCVSAARADLMIDQQNTTNSTFTVTGLTSLGQTFTPTLGSLNFATFIISDTAVSTFKVQVYSGIGYSGTLLGESAAQSVALAPTPPNGQPFTVDNAQLVEFDFATSVLLAPGNSYTLRVIQATGSGGFLFFRTGLNNPYAGGTAYDVAPITGIDFVFGEGIRTPASVPEPSSMMLLASGVVGILGTLRRRK